jgi:sugar phosphate isomerase/epimerase
MPWTDARDLPQAARIVERTGRDNAGVLIDPFHLSRSRSRIEDIAPISPSRLRFMQFCDVPAAIPPTERRPCRAGQDARRQVARFSVGGGRRVRVTPGEPACILVRIHLAANIRAS